MPLGVVSLIVADAPDARFIPVKYCAHTSSPFVESANENAFPLKLTDWPVPGAIACVLLKFDRAARTSELEPTSDAIVADGVPPLAAEADCVPPFCVPDCPVTTATPNPHEAAEATFAVTVSDAEDVTVPSQILADAWVPDTAVIVAAPFHEIVPPVFVGDVCRFALIALANMTTSKLPVGGVKLAVVSEVAAVDV